MPRQIAFALFFVVSLTAADAEIRQNTNVKESEYLSDNGNNHVTVQADVELDQELDEAIEVLASEIVAENESQETDEVLSSSMMEAEKELTELENFKAATNMVMSNGIVQAQILGQSGKIRLTPLNSGAPSAGTEITITMDSLFEVDAGNNTVGVAGKANNKKHSRNTFASTSFSFSNFDAVLDANGDVIADRINFTATLVGSSTLQVSILIFRVNTSIHVGDSEDFDVTAGSLKFSVSVANWPFCDATVTNTKSDAYCIKGGVRETGTQLLFSFKVEVADNLAAGFSSAGVLQYTLANTVSYQLSQQVQYSTGWTSMTAPYPLVWFGSDPVTTNIFSVSMIAFDKFSGSAFYDPVVTLNVGDAQPTPLPSPPPAPSVTTSCGRKKNGSKCSKDSDCKSCKCRLSGKKKICVA